MATEATCCCCCCCHCHWRSLSFIYSLQAKSKTNRPIALIESGPPMLLLLPIIQCHYVATLPKRSRLASIERHHDNLVMTLELSFIACQSNIRSPPVCLSELGTHYDRQQRIVWLLVYMCLLTCSLDLPQHIAQGEPVA